MIARIIDIGAALCVLLFLHQRITGVPMGPADWLLIGFWVGSICTGLWVYFQCKQSAPQGPPESHAGRGLDG
jgi:hypothetical protein